LHQVPEPEAEPAVEAAVVAPAAEDEPEEEDTAGKKKKKKNVQLLAGLDKGIEGAIAKGSALVTKSYGTAHRLTLKVSPRR
jgi:hypothetical protein